MAEVLIKAELKEGDTIHVGFNTVKSEIKIKIQKKKEAACPQPPKGASFSISLQGDRRTAGFPYKSKSAEPVICIS